MKERINRLRSTAARICHHSAAARSLTNRLDQLFAYELAGKKHVPLVLDSRFRAVYLKIATASLDLGCGGGFFGLKTCDRFVEGVLACPGVLNGY